MKVKPIPIEWHPGLPVFALESFLKSVGDEYGWLGGFSESGELRCVLPYTLIKKLIFRMVRFRVETISLRGELSLDEEKSFLNEAMKYFRSLSADLVIPASNNAIFRTYPEGAIAAPYGSYVIDLTQSEEALWRNLDRILRQNIKTAQKAGVFINSGFQNLETAYALTRDTFKRSKLPFMSFPAFNKYFLGLGENGVLLTADYLGIVQSSVFFASSNYCAYAIYAGNIPNQIQGSNKLLYWEAMRLFKLQGVKRFDFMGARINPEKGSKQEALSHFKKRFGAILKEGYIWKYVFHPFKYRLYRLAIYTRSGGDIVDAERHKMKDLPRIQC
jgi:hypothetical protein